MNSELKKTSNLLFYFSKGQNFVFFSEFREQLAAFKEQRYVNINSTKEGTKQMLQNNNKISFNFNTHFAMLR